MGLQIGSGDQTRASHFVEEKKEEEEGGGRRGGWKGGGRWEVCVHAVVVVLAGVVRVLGVNNSNDFPNLAQSGMWMAALERNWVYLALCLFLYWEETEEKKTEEEVGCVCGGGVPSSCRRSRLMEEVQNKLFRSDEVKISPVHLQTFAAEVAGAESQAAFMNTQTERWRGNLPLQKRADNINLWCDVNINVNHFNSQAIAA